MAGAWRRHARSEQIRADAHQGCTFVDRRLQIRRSCPSTAYRVPAPSAFTLSNSCRNCCSQCRWRAGIRLRRRQTHQPAQLQPRKFTRYRAAAAAPRPGRRHLCGLRRRSAPARIRSGAGHGRDAARTAARRCAAGRRRGPTRSSRPPARVLLACSAPMKCQMTGAPDRTLQPAPPSWAGRPGRSFPRNRAAPRPWRRARTAADCPLLAPTSVIWSTLRPDSTCGSAGSAPVRARHSRQGAAPLPNSVDLLTYGWADPSAILEVESRLPSVEEFQWP